MPGSQTDFALAVAFSETTPPFDGVHRSMTFGFARTDEAGVWRPISGPRPLHQFELLSAGSGSGFFLRIHTNDPIDDDKPAAVVFSARPAIESVAAGNPFLGSPFPKTGPNIPFTRSQIPDVRRNRRSPGLDNELFAYSWEIGPVPLLSLGEGQEVRFELLIELRVSIGGRIFDFKVDPELVVKGGG